MSDQPSTKLEKAFKIYKEIQLEVVEAYEGNTLTPSKMQELLNKQKEAMEKLRLEVETSAP